MLPSLTNVGLVVLGAYRVRSGRHDRRRAVELHLPVHAARVPAAADRLRAVRAAALAGRLGRVREVLDEPIEPDPVAAIGGRARQDAGCSSSTSATRSRRDARRAAWRRRSTSPPGASSPSSVPPAPARPRSSRSSADSSRPTRAPLRSGAGGRAIVFQEPFLFAGSVRQNVVLGDERFGDDDAVGGTAPGAAPSASSTTARGPRHHGRRAWRRPQRRAAPAHRARPGRWCAGQRCCCSTTRRRRSTRRPRVPCSPTCAACSTGTTVLMVASRPSTIALADEVVYLADGVVVAHGPHVELMARQRRLPRADARRSRPTAATPTTTPRCTPPVVAGEQPAVDEPVGRFGAAQTIGRGLQEAPVLRQGLGVTWGLAVVGATGRVVVPILLQQAIDRGRRRERRRRRLRRRAGADRGRGVVHRLARPAHGGRAAGAAQRAGAVPVCGRGCSRTSTG